jgi:hypothetical protein
LECECVTVLATPTQQCTHTHTQTRTHTGHWKQRRRAHSGKSLLGEDQWDCDDAAFVKKEITLDAPRNLLCHAHHNSHPATKHMSQRAREVGGACARTHTRRWQPTAHAVSHEKRMNAAVCLRLVEAVPCWSNACSVKRAIRWTSANLRVRETRHDARQTLHCLAQHASGVVRTACQLGVLSGTLDALFGFLVTCMRSGRQVKKAAGDGGASTCRPRVCVTHSFSPYQTSTTDELVHLSSTTPPSLSLTHTHCTHDMHLGPCFKAWITVRGWAQRRCRGEREQAHRIGWHVHLGQE